MMENTYENFIRESSLEADKNMRFFVYGFFLFGLLIAPYYDTWAFALGIGGSSLAAYFVTQLFMPGTLLSRITISLIFGVYMLQFIGQMHGMYEMHFFFFTNIAILIIYKDWRIVAPYTILTVAHHALLFYLQMNGYDVKEYFVNVNNLTYIVLVLHLGIAAFMGVICGWWSIILKKHSMKDFENKLNYEKQLANMGKNIQFASEITKGNLEINFESNTNDDLGKSLQEMRNSLQEAAQKERVEKFKNIGIAEISNILRDHSDSLNDLSYQVISKLVKYMNLNQGGMFIIKEDADHTPYLDLTACYAFDRKKYLDRKIKIGQGLVGQAVLEKDYIYMTDIPENYINITSGLGYANPRCILIMPLKSNDEVVGVMEFASFNEFTKYEIAFLEKIGENIAASIISAQTNETTRVLLQQSREQAEEMRAQEEEMRQNMEELQATQEEMYRKSAEYEQLIKQKDKEIERLRNMELVVE